MKLTVIVTVYNIAEYLPRFFDSMAKQSFKDYCLLMIDDGSEDNSLQVCSDYAKKDNRIKVVGLEHVGIAKARNIAMGYIETEFTAYADGDDYVEPDYLKHLMDAQKKHDADLVISRVIYQLQKDDVVESEFPSRGELYIPRDDFEEKLPLLLDDRRLNYLYSKVYRSSLLKDIRVEDDVRQGSDTMINCQYIAKANSIVLIDDLDYHYIRYYSRSVTSYSGDDAFFRILRINNFVYDFMKKADFLSSDMQFIIDKRILLSAIWVIEKIVSSNSENEAKENQITSILNDTFYVQSYNRQKGNISKLGFEPLPPQSGKKYLKSKLSEIKSNQRKAKILASCPKFVVDLYHKIKKS